ncbi:MAG: AraC family transcriptional regulator [Eubacteriales bacterium]
MFLEIQKHKHYYDFCDPDLHIVEFGHSVLPNPKTVPIRVRDIYIIHFIISGNCSFCNQTLSRGTVFITVPKVVHSFSVSEGYEHFWICFSGNNTEKILNLFNIPTTELSYFHIASEVDYIYLEKTLKEAFETTSEKCAISALLAVLSVLKIPNAEHSLSHAEKAKKFIENNYYRNLTMNDVANYLYISEKHFCRIFKNKFKITPKRYLLELRMNKARDLILGTDMLIKEISVSVGYDSPFTFSEAFSGFFGYSPSELRRNNSE